MRLRAEQAEKVKWNRKLKFDNQVKRKQKIEAKKLEKLRWLKVHSIVVQALKDAGKLRPNGAFTLKDARSVAEAAGIKLSETRKITKSNLLKLWTQWFHNDNAPSSDSSELESLSSSYSEDEISNEEELYCHCKQPASEWLGEEKEPLILCQGGCGIWYHLTCVGIKESETEFIGYAVVNSVTTNIKNPIKPNFNSL